MWPRLGEVFLLQCCGNRLFLLTGETHQVSEALSAAALYSGKGGVGTKLWPRSTSDLEESENHLKRSKTRKASHLNEVAIL